MVGFDTFPLNRITVRGICTISAITQRASIYHKYQWTGTSGKVKIQVKRYFDALHKNFLLLLWLEQKLHQHFYPYYGETTVAFVNQDQVWQTIASPRDSSFDNNCKQRSTHILWNSGYRKLSCCFGVLKSSLRMRKDTEGPASLTPKLIAQRGKDTIILLIYCILYPSVFTLLFWSLRFLVTQLDKPTKSGGIAWMIPSRQPKIKYV